jgi:hypothetical protein
VTDEQIEGLAALVSTFSKGIAEVFGEGRSGEALVGIATDLLVHEGKSLEDAVSLVTGCYQRAVTLHGQTVAEGSQTVMRQGFGFGRRVTGEGDARFVGVTQCRDCQLVNSHDDLGVCRSCIGPLEVLRVPLADVAQALGNQGLTVVGPSSELSSEDLCAIVLLAGEICYPIAPADFVMGIGIGRLLSLGRGRDHVLEVAMATIDSVLGGSELDLDVSLRAPPSAPN